MSDTIRTDAWANAMSLVSSGVATAWDNHGNSTSGYTLTCAGKKPITLGFFEHDGLSSDLGILRIANLLNFDGEVHVPSSHSSPLQHLCRKIEAETHHAPSPVTGHRV
jgi:hypothetical protein